MMSKNETTKNASTASNNTTIAANTASTIIATTNASNTVSTATTNASNTANNAKTDTTNASTNTTIAANNVSNTASTINANTANTDTINANTANTASKAYSIPSTHTEESNNPMIRTEHLTKKINGKLIVNDLTLSIPAGSMFALLGPNGAGKTTTTRLLTGMLHPSKGHAYINGIEMNDNTGSELRGIMGIQVDGNAYNNMTVIDNLDLWAEIYNVPHKLKEQRINNMIDNFLLGDYKNMKVGELSKGNRQKVLIARALIPKPQLIFLDEPTSGIDPQSSTGLMHALHEMVINDNATVFMNTHRLQGLDGLVDAIGVMEHGELIEAGLVNDMIHARWPKLEYELHTDNDDNKDYYNLIKNMITINASTGFIELNENVKPYEVLNRLVNAGVKVNEFTCHHRTIQDLYLDKVKHGDWSDEF